MKNKTPYDIVKNRYVTEKTEVLLGLHKSEGNASLRKCKTPKYVFVVDKNANKTEVASAVELIYAESKIRVVSVNIINAKKKPKLMRGRVGSKSAFKKAIVTLEAGDLLPENV
jgi:large subunit ribosomal protein L23